MDLKKVMFWKQTPSDLLQATEAPLTTEPTSDAQFDCSSVDQSSSPVAKVVRIPRSDAEWLSAESSVSNDFVKPAPKSVRVKGLMNAPELEAFFQENQFGFGRHHGSLYRTQEALDRGLLALVASFQNILSDLAERRQARIDKLQQTRQDVASLSPMMADKVVLACEQMQREIAVLMEQHALADQKKGWVLDALNRYRLGFDRGAREALDFELLNV